MSLECKFKTDSHVDFNLCKLVFDINRIWKFKYHHDDVAIFLWRDRDNEKKRVKGLLELVRSYLDANTHYIVDNRRERRI